MATTSTIPRADNSAKIAFLAIAFIVFAALLFFKSFSTTTTAPAAVIKPASRLFYKTNHVKMIYAGTPSTARYYDFAINGQIKPIGGPAGILDLYLGDQNSNFTMCYLDIMSAYMAATLDNTVAGTLSMIPACKINESQIVTAEQAKCNDVFNEKPIFIKGITSGWVSFKVKPLMSRNDILNLK